MLRRFSSFVLTAALLCPITAFAQAPAATPPPAAAPTAPSAAPAPASPNRAGGRITAVDATAKTITLTRGQTTTVLSVPDTAKIYKVGETDQPTGTFADLVVGTRVNATTDGSTTAPVAKTVHLRAPRTAAPPAAPAVP